MRILEVLLVCGWSTMELWLVWRHSLVVWRHWLVVWKHCRVLVTVASTWTTEISTLWFVLVITRLVVRNCG